MLYVQKPGARQDWHILSNDWAPWTLCNSPVSLRKAALMTEAQMDRAKETVDLPICRDCRRNLEEAMERAG